MNIHEKRVILGLLKKWANDKDEWDGSNHEDGENKFEWKEK